MEEHTLLTNKKGAYIYIFENNFNVHYGMLFIFVVFTLCIVFAWIVWEWLFFPPLSSCSTLSAKMEGGRHGNRAEGGGERGRGSDPSRLTPHDKGVRYFMSSWWFTKQTLLPCVNLVALCKLSIFYFLWCGSAAGARREDGATQIIICFYLMTVVTNKSDEQCEN